jgi:hypothetical protein
MSKGVVTGRAPLSDPSEVDELQYIFHFLSQVRIFFTPVVELRQSHLSDCRLWSGFQRDLSGRCLLNTEADAWESGGGVVFWI